MPSVLAIGLALLLRQGADFDQIVQDHLRATGTPACSVAVVQNGKLLFAKGYGLANVEAPAAATPDTIYRIGSLTKQFTATLVMKLVGEGKLKLDDPIDKYLTDLAPTYKGVTVRQLLNHTSGLRSITEFPTFAKDELRDTTPKEMLSLIGQAKPDFAPGQAWKYNNSGYIVLGYLVEKIEGKPWAEVLESRIAGPLGMTATHASDLSKVVVGRAAGYRSDGKDLANAPYSSMSWPYAAGVLESSAQDLAKWCVALEEGRVLPADLTAQMLAPTALPGGKSQDYGFAWAVPKVNGIQLVEHNGAIHGFNAYIGRVPARSLAVVVLTNSDQGNAFSLGRKLLGTYEPKLKTQTPATIADADPELSKFLRGRLEALLAGTLTSADLTPEFAKVLTADRIKEAHSALGSLGPVGKFDLTASTKEGDLAVRTYRVSIGPVELEVRFAIAKDRKLAGMTLKG